LVFRLSGKSERRERENERVDESCVQFFRPSFAFDFFIPNIIIIIMHNLNNVQTSSSSKKSVL